MATRGTDSEPGAATRQRDSDTREAPRGGEGDDSLLRVARAGGPTRRCETRRATTSTACAATSSPRSLPTIRGYLFNYIFSSVAALDFGEGEPQIYDRREKPKRQGLHPAPYAVGL